MPAHLRMEQRFIALRYLGLFSLAPTLPLLNLTSGRLAAAYALLCFTALYNMTIQFLLRRRSTWLNNGYFTTIGDGILNIAMVIIGGGFGSPFYFILFTTSIAAAMRYGYGPTLLVVGIYVMLDALSSRLFSTGNASATADLFFRSGFLVITALLAGYLREQARAAEAALAQELARAGALNESSRAVSASLQLSTVARTVAVEARRLAGAECALLRLGPHASADVTYDGVEAQDCSSDQADDQQAILNALLHEAIADSAPVVEQGTTDDHRPFMLVPLQTRSALLGYVGVLRAAHQPPFQPHDTALLTSFIERARLALENASLYKTIGDRSQDLQRAYADLAAAHQELLGVDEMKTNFIANVSHELRTPLTSIRSFSELLLSYEVDKPTEREFLGIINTESERLTRLINDVLDITKIEAGQVDWRIEPHNLADLLQTSARSFAQIIADHQLAFICEAPPPDIKVLADRDRILQVLANLLGNAVKFTTQGQIKLDAAIVGESATIRVSDTGIGIAPADHERIFEKFHQVGDTLTDKPKGTGLGLCICRDIVHQHGGRLWVESGIGQGSTFIFTLPLHVAPAA